MASFSPLTILGGKYKILQAVGGGGMALIYRVEQLTAPGQSWALKVMHPPSNDPAERLQARALFRQEAELLARLDHRHLPKVVDYFDDTRHSYLVMEFIEGQSLEKHLARMGGPLPEKAVLHWVMQICDVLDYLHLQQPDPIIFRDLKPANVMLSQEGIIKLIDFGIARTYKASKKKDTIRMGSENYAPLEQWGRGQTDARSDLYALGATMYHLLTHWPPPPATEPLLSPPRQLAPSLSTQTEEVIVKAMARSPDNRYPNAQEMKRAVEGCLLVLNAPDILSSTPVSAERCPVCHVANRPSARFCRQCGTPLPGPLLGLLHLLRPGGGSVTQALGKLPFLIGRATPEDGFQPDLDLSLYDTQFVSRRHAQISYNGSHYHLTDLGSANGTVVNGVRLLPHAPHTLQTGDKIGIGKVRLEFALTTR